MTTDRKLSPLTLALLLASPLATQASDDAVLDAIVVTAPALTGTLRTTPHNVSVITRDDIERSTAQTVGDLLGRLANVQLRGFDGNDSNAVVDIRGMGDTALSNVIILVDGVRLNETDLSGADLTTVPLSQIERIEVLRGGGSVRYGDGAVGGVIDIRTRGAASAIPHGTLTLKTGSDDLREMQAWAGGGSGPWRLGATWRRLLTDGYRDNGQIDARDYTFDLRGSFGAIEIHANIANHRDRSGLPGPVSREAFEAGDRERRATRFADDTSRSDDTRHTLGLLAEVGSEGLFELQFSQRERENRWILGYNPLISTADQQGEIRTRRHEVHATYTQGFAFSGQTHSLRLGYDLLDGDYTRRENGRQVAENSTLLAGEVRSRGVYAELTASLSDTLTLTTGYRKSRFDTREKKHAYKRVCEYITVPPFPFPFPVDCQNQWVNQSAHGAIWSNHSAGLGLTWQVNPATTVFGGFSQHFRSPNIDELMLAAATLQPQQGHTAEVGVRYAPYRRLHLAATLFRMETEDEIYFGVEPATGASVNRNYEDSTRRIGVELEGRWQAHPRLWLNASFGYIQPRFVGSGADIPHVARRTASAQAELTFPHGIRLTLAAHHVGRRFDGNDLDNTLYPVLPSYTVWDTALHVDLGAVQITAGVNNLTGKAYSALGYSGTFYPMPGRTAHIAASIAF